ncbi:unnamed protein product [Adineta steineri]|uniref:Uncharacterized protein n=1 Tax=Adineta steineri TaxID=433720 RepID=A0A814YEW0_9BILA|nr:unnamed protein product [Adineta steineri]CAF1362226.1 unnamed protein product [Adineta steineri]
MPTDVTKETAPATQKQDDCFAVGDWLYVECKYEKAREHFQNVLKRPSLSASESGDYVQAIKYHHEALDAGCLTSNPTVMSTIYKNLANIHTNTKEFKLSRENFQKALEIDRQRLRKDHLQFGQTYANMGKMYQAEGNYKEALAYFEKAREIWLKTLAPTHVYIEKIEKIVGKMKSKLVQMDAGAQTPEQPMNHFDILARNNVMIIWLDEYIGRDENCRELKEEFRQITNSLKMVDSVESCRQCLEHVKDRKLFFIIQGKYAKQVVPEIVQIIPPSMKPVVYIFCFNMTYLMEWAQEQECIMEGGMFDHEKDLLLRLTNDLNNYVKQKSVEYANYLQPELISKFLAELKQMFEGCCKVKDALTSPDQTDHDANQATTIMAQ